MNTTTKQPETLVEAIRYFADPEVALAFMVRYVWPDGPVCPECGGKDHYFLKTRQTWKCKNKECAKQFSVKTGTVMEDSPLSLDKWIIAFWMILNAKNGVSSWELHRAIGVTQKSAWFLLHRIRHAMKHGSFQKMSGTVEADESFVGGKLRNMKKSKLAAMRAEAKKPGRPVRLTGTVGKAIIMGLLERGENGEASQMRTTMIESTRRPHIQDAVKQNVEPQSFVMTDALSSYTGLQAEYIHMTINHALSYAKGRIHTNGIENFWSLLKRSLKGTYVAVEPFHLEAYLDEQCLRFNLRKLTDGQRFTQTLGMVAGKRITYAELTGKVTAGEEIPGIQA